MSYVFISYNHIDTFHATKLAKLLEEVNISTWMDTKNITLGKEWRQEIDDAIRKAFAVIVVWTPNASSPYITYEWSFALGAGIEVIPLVFEHHSMHSRMDVLQYVSIKEPQWESKLIKRLNQLDERYRDPRRIPLDTTLVSDAELQLNINRLNSQYEDDREQAAYALAELKNPRAIPALVTAMVYEDTELYMIQAIGKIGHARGIEVLLRIIRQRLETSTFWSSVGSVVTQALEALESIGEPAVPSIIKSLYIKNSWETLAQTIIKIGRPALPYLIEALSDENKEIRSTVAVIIGQILKGDKFAPEEIIVQLANCLSDQDIASSAEDALQEIGSEKALHAIAKYNSQK